MKRIYSCLIVCLLLFCFSSCILDYSFSYMSGTSNVSDIETIEIVKVNNSLIYKELKINTLAVIEDKEMFLIDFAEIRWEKVDGTPYAISGGATAFKFQYKNGDYELITAQGIAQYYAACHVDCESVDKGGCYHPIAGTIVGGKSTFYNIATKYLSQNKGT